MQTSVHLITFEESLLLPENKLEEILDGESRVMPPPTARHYLLLREVTQQLERMRTGIEVWPASFGLGIRRSPFRYRIPDVSVFSAKVIAQETFLHPEDPYIWTTPLLIAECLSPSNRRGRVEELMADYESIGVPEVWLFYPEKRLFECYLLTEGTLQLRPSELSGRLALDQVWRAFHGD